MAVQSVPSSSRREKFPCKQVVVPLPDEAGRADVLRVHIRGVPLAEDPDTICATLAKATAGCLWRACLSSVLVER